MGKLADLIQRATRPHIAPLGFGTARSKPSPTMIIVAVIGARWKDNVSEATSSGAAAVLLTGGPSENDMKAAAEAAGDSACGVVANGTTGLSEAGVDFVILGNDAPASALQDEDMTFLLQVDEDLSDIQLRTIEPLPIDALYLEAPGDALTIGRQMDLQRITGLARKPMLTAPVSDVSQDDLLSLRDSGVLLLAVDMNASEATKTLSHLQKLVGGLPPRRARRRGEKAEVALPTPSHGHEEHDEDDEE